MHANSFLAMRIADECASCSWRSTCSYDYATAITSQTNTTFLAHNRMGPSRGSADAHPRAAGRVQHHPHLVQSAPAVRRLRPPALGRAIVAVAQPVGQYQGRCPTRGLVCGLAVHPRRIGRCTYLVLPYTRKPRTDPLARCP